MLIVDIAKIALAAFPRDQAQVMIAIEAGESGHNNAARGDPVSAFPPEQQPTYQRYSCGGYTSIGLWQVNMRWHYPKLQTLTGSVDPCVWANWLTNPFNNAQIAEQIRAGQGLSAWSVYNAGVYLRFMADAAAAIQEATAPPPVPPVPPPPPPPPPDTWGPRVQDDALLMLKILRIGEAHKKAYEQEVFNAILRH